jgi:hypothetical protein
MRAALVICRSEDIVPNEADRVITGWELRPALCIATVSAAESCEGNGAAFQKTLRAPELSAEAERSKLNIRPISGAELHSMILESYR